MDKTTPPKDKLDGDLDFSTRRDSGSSLNRQHSGSLTQRIRLGSSSSGSSPASGTSGGGQMKDLDKFTKCFIIKTFQVILQSRIAGFERLKTDCKPSGNDWFNINIPDVPEISEKIKTSLDLDSLSVKAKWRVCCEISLVNSDGGGIVLEHWIFSNRPNIESSSGAVAPRLIPNQASPSSQQQIRVSPINTPDSTSTSGLLCTVNSPSSSRVRPTTYSSTTRPRLNSIHDYSGDNGLIEENILDDFEPSSSKSCYALSTASNTNPAEQINLLTTSPSINSLSGNNPRLSSINPTSPPQSSKSSASSIYTIYNRMSLLLKTIMTTAHILPAHRMKSSTSSDDECSFCYRVYNFNSPNQSFKSNTSPARSSSEDMSVNPTCDSPSRRSISSNVSLGSLDVRDFVSSEEVEHFCRIQSVGSVKTEFSELDVSMCYRTDLKNSSQFANGSPGRDEYCANLDEDCVTAAKTLLAGNGNNSLSDLDDDDIESAAKDEEAARAKFFKTPLNPAFACPELTRERLSKDADLVLMDCIFEDLLKPPKLDSQEHPKAGPSKTRKESSSVRKSSKVAPSDSPHSSGRARKSAHDESNQKSSPISKSERKSLIDSFVFVDLNPPFASEEQNDINSFFHGPSPAFGDRSDNLRSVDDITQQLAILEASASQIDEFVDKICATESESE